MQRTSNLPLDDAAAGAPAVVIGSNNNTSELQILRAEVAESGETISKLENQLATSEAEMAQISQRTAEMEEELRSMRERAGDLAIQGAREGGSRGEGAGELPPPSPAVTAATPTEAAHNDDLGPMAVSITLPADADFEADPSSLRVSISIGGSG
jgi:TolA-binding protein